MSGAVFKTGARVRLKHDPDRVGVVTGKTREFGGCRWWQVIFPDGTQYVPDDQLEVVRKGGDDPLDLLRRRRLGDELGLRRTITHARLTGRLADVIYSMDTTGTDFYAHQFKPVVKLMNSAGRGILIADEVGLGKTIEAGLLWTELRTRFDFRRLLVLCPAVLREKWKRELERRFGVDAEILDARGTLERLQRADGQGRHFDFAIVASLQGLRPESGWNDWADGGKHGPASRLARFLDDRGQDDPIVDMCVIDEAHYLRNRETMTSALGRLVGAVSDYIVLLSATPIHLRSGDLFELVRLLDDDTFDRRESFDDILEANGPLVHARDLILRGDRGPDSRAPAMLEGELRRAHGNPLLAGSRQLRALIDERVWERDLAKPAVAARLADRLDRVNLLGHVVTRTRKRDVEERKVIRDVKAESVPLSPPEAAFYEAVTTVVREYCMQRGAHEGFLQVTPQRQMCSSMPAALHLWQQDAPSGEDETGEDPDEMERPLRAELTARARDLGNLGELWRSDSKYERIHTVLKSLLDRDRTEKVVVFSYFRATLHYLHERLGNDGVQAILLHGGVPDKDATISRFRESRDVIVLLSSEVGSEGIDLQFARIVINYDLPWNPMQVEQRIGRIDRLGQRAEKIHVWNLFYDDTIDARIYERLFERLRIFEGALGAIEPVLGDMIQKMTHDLFSGQLTPREEIERIDQTSLALENRRRDEEELEREAAGLTAYGDYILNQVKAARDLHRSISAKDIQSYVLDYLRINYPGSEFRQTSDDPARFDANLSSNARTDLAAYLGRERLQTSTRMAQYSVSKVRCRFENTAVPDLRGLEEVVSQFHPLVRFVADRLSAPDEQIRSAVAIRLPLDKLDFDLAPGRYAFSVQRWSVRGLRDMERLHYAAAPLDDGGDMLEPADAERLVVVAAGEGRQWPGGRDAVDDAVVDAVEEGCIVSSEEAFGQYAGDLERENHDRADVQERMLDDHYRNQKTRIESVLEKYRTEGRLRLVPATEGRLDALKRRTDRRRQEIRERRDLTYRNELVCVGIVEVHAANQDRAGLQRGVT